MPPATATSPAPKPTAAEMKARVRIVIDLLTQGYRRRGIVRYAAKTWGIRSRAVDTLLARAHEQITRGVERRCTLLVNMMVAKVRGVYARTLAVGDLRAALACLEFECKLLGLYPNTRPNFKLLSDGQLERELADLTESSPHPGAGTGPDRPGAAGGNEPSTVA